MSQGGSQQEDGKYVTEFSPSDLEEELAEVRRRGKTATTMKVLAVFIAITVVITVLFAFFLRSDCLDCDGWTMNHPMVGLIVSNRTDNWTLLVASVSHSMHLDLVKATIYNDEGVALSPLISVKLSHLTLDNFTTFHVRYEKFYNETHLTVGGTLIIEKAEYPRAHRLLLYFQDYIVCWAYLPRI